MVEAIESLRNIAGFFLSLAVAGAPFTTRIEKMRSVHCTTNRVPQAACIVGTLPLNALPASAGAFALRLSRSCALRALVTVPVPQG